MRRHLQKVQLGISFLLSLCFPAIAQHDQDQLAAFLQKRGFDHVAIRAQAKTAGLVYENFGYRSEILAAKMAAAGMATVFRQQQHLYMLPLYSGVPMVLLQNDAGEMATLHWQQHELQIPQFRIVENAFTPTGPKLNFQPAFHPRAELIVHPDMSALFGNYSDPLRARINLVPELRLSLWRGVQFSSHVIFPVYDEIGDGQIRPGPMWLTHLFRVRRTLVFYTAGLLQNEQYGIQFGTHTFFHSNWAFSTRMGYSGAAIWQQQKMYLAQLQHFTYTAKLIYFNQRFRFFASLGYHRFLDEKNGWRFDFYRYFHELRAGFWGMSLQGEMNGGFHVAIPLPPFKYKSTKRLRIRPANYFRWEYRAAGLNNAGQPLKANIYLDDQFDRYTPAFLNARL